MQAITSGETLKITSNIDCKLFIENFYKELADDISNLKDTNVVDSDKFASKSLSHSLHRSVNYINEKETLKNIIFNAAYDCERFIGGSGDTYFLILEHFLRLPKEKRIETVQTYLSRSGVLLGKKRKITKRDVNRVTKYMDSYSRDLINKSLNMCTPKTVINLEKSNMIDDRLIKKDSLYFNIKPIPGFLTEKWIREDVNLLLVDGVIDKVTEIHHMLTQAAISKEPYLLITKGYSREVLHTLGDNVAKGIVDIVPIDLGKTMDYHHFMKDLSRLYDIEYASAEFGDVISVFIRRGLPKIPKAIVSNTLELFINDYEQLHSLRSEVFELMSMNLGFEVDDLIKKRLNYLTSDKLIISIGKDSAINNPVIIEELDIFIRRFISLTRDGVVYTKIPWISNKNKIYSSVEISFILDRILSVIKTINTIQCIVYKKE